MGTAQSSEQIIGMTVLGGLAFTIVLAIALISRALAQRMPKPHGYDFPPVAGDIAVHGLLMRRNRGVVAARVAQLVVENKLQVIAPNGPQGIIGVAPTAGSGLTTADKLFLGVFRPEVQSKRRRAKYWRALAEAGIFVANPDTPPEVYFLTGPAAFRGYRRGAVKRYIDRLYIDMRDVGATAQYPIKIHLDILAVLFMAIFFAGVFLGLGEFLTGEWISGAIAVATVILSGWATSLAAPPMPRFIEYGEKLRSRLAGIEAFIKDSKHQLPAPWFDPNDYARLIVALAPYAILVECRTPWLQHLRILGVPQSHLDQLEWVAASVESVAIRNQALARVGYTLRKLAAVFS